MRRRTGEAVYTALKRRIVLNELRPGLVLTELGLARELDCSQASVREALLRLQEDGLVLRAGHRGTSVTPLDPEEAREILTLRRQIEVRAAPRAARAADAATLERARTLLEAMRVAAAAGDAWALIEADTEFHLAIFRAAGLRALEQILVRCILHSHRQKLWEPRHRRPLAATAERHVILLEHLSAGDGEGLARALGRHIDTIVEVEEASDRARAS